MVFIRHSLVLITLYLVSLSVGKAAEYDSSANSFLNEPFLEIQEDVCKFTATIAVAMDGSVLVFKDQRERGVLEVVRSVDGGVSWSDPILVGPTVEIEGDTFDDGRYTRGPGSHHGRSVLGNVVVDETTGDILLFTSSMKPALVLYRSQDHGKSWKQEAFELKPDVNGWLPSLIATSESGITLRHGNHPGRLLVPTRVFVGYLNKGQNNRYFEEHYSNAMFSDDGGKSWTSSAPFPRAGTGEAALAELSDGRIYYNSRNHLLRGNRRIAWSNDGGETWENEYESAYLPDGPPDRYGCKGGLVRLPVHDQDILVYSSPGNPTVGGSSDRDDSTVWVSLDGAKTWPHKRLVRDGPGGYTYLAAGRPGTPSEGMIFLYCTVSKNTDAYLARFNLAWIMEDESGESSKPR